MQFGVCLSSTSFSFIFLLINMAHTPPAKSQIFRKLTPNNLNPVTDLGKIQISPPNLSKCNGKQ